MNAANHSAHFRSLGRIRQIAGGVIVLLALTLAAPLALVGSPQLLSINLTKNTLVRNGNDSITATVTISCPSGYNGYEWNAGLSTANGYLLIPSAAGLVCTTAPTVTSAPFYITPNVRGGTSPVTDTLTATVPYGNYTLSQTITISPLVPTLTISPGTLRDGLGTSLTATLSTGGVQVYNGAGGYNFAASAGGLNFSGASIPNGQSSVTFQISQGTAVSANTAVTITATSSSTAQMYGANTASASVLVRPAGTGTVSPAEVGPCRDCMKLSGKPINVTNGNVWIDQRDYSVPGLGGGLALSRVWNSQWLYSNPPTPAGMFGLGWQSTYEEQVVPVSSDTVIYWRGDGSGWTFAYNSALNTYALASPPNVSVWTWPS